MEELDINRIKLLLLAFLIFTIGSCVGTAAEIHVQQGGSIQAAVNSAHSGDTIIVESGNYVGNIDISKFNDLNDLVLVAASDDPAKTVISANNSAPATVGGVITIKGKTNVRIKGFTIIGASRTNAAGDPNLAGVYLSQSKQCTVENNIFLNDGIGVKVETATGSNTVNNNSIDRSIKVGTGIGISLDGAISTTVSNNPVSNQNIGIKVNGANCRGSLLSGNTINNNANYGIELEQARNVNIDGNTLNLNGYSAVYLSFSDVNNVTNNKMQMIGYQVNGTNTNAIYLSNSNSNTVLNNVESNAEHGIFLFTCDKNTVQNNKVSANDYGIAMRFSHNNNVIGNTADGNNWGIFCTFEDSGNIISGNNANMCVNAGIFLNSNC